MYAPEMYVWRLGRMKRERSSRTMAGYFTLHLVEKCSEIMVQYCKIHCKELSKDKKTVVLS